MANTINKTTDDALLRSIIDGSITEFMDDTVEGILPSYKFYNCTDLEKVDIKNIKRIYKEVFNNCSSLKIGIFPSVISIGHSAFSNCTSLESLDLSNVRLEGSVNNDDGSVNMYIFRNCTNLKQLRFDKLGYTTGGNRPFTYDSGTEIVVLPSISIFKNGNFGGCPIKKLDIGKKVSLFTDSSYNLASSNFEALIIRAEVVAPLDHANLLGNSYFANDSTKGQSGKNSTYKIYVPQSLISEYQSATNWSAYSTFFEPIEGSKYDGYWADGVPIGLEHPYGMIGYYDVGKENDWNSETKILASHVDNGFSAYNGPGFNYTNASMSSIPASFSYPVASSSLLINFGQALSEISDTITLEYVLARPSGNTNWRLSGALSSSQTPTWTFGISDSGYSSISARTLHHFVVELNSSGVVKAYIDGILIEQDEEINNCLAVSKIVIGGDVLSNNRYNALSYVTIYDRALSSSEISEHYKWAVENRCAGKCAYDSSGNFIGAYPSALSPNGLIGYYEVGNENNYEAITNVPSHINSSVESDLVAYTSTSHNSSNASNNSKAQLPDSYYQGYGKHACLCIYSSEAFLSNYDVFTIEFSSALNASDAYIGATTWGSYKSTITGSTTITVPNGSTFLISGLSQKVFLHKIVEYNKNGTVKTYINGTLRDTRTVDTTNLSNMNWVSCGYPDDTSAYLGPVAVYNRALTESEIAAHYQYYVDNYMVGQTVYDSNGKFIIGFPSGLSTDSAIGFYNVGDESKYEGIHDFPTHIDSIIQNDSVVGYGGVGHWNDPREHITPYLFEDGFAINESYGFGVGCNFYCIDNTFGSLYDVMTIEYVYAGSRGSQAGPLVYGRNKSSFTNTGNQTWGCNESWSYTNGDKEFRHYLVEIHSDGTVKRYINGVAKANQTITTPLNVNCITIGQTDSFAISAIGPVIVYSRALTSEEIAQHYQWYVTNYRVGELAFDSSGNFIPAQSS